MSRLTKFILRATAGTPSDEPVPTKMSELLEELITRLEAVDAGSGDSVNTGPLFPAPSDSGKPWIREDADGRPLGLYQDYQGAWYAIQVPVGGQIFFFGSLTDIKYPWFLADGNNGTTNRTADYPAGGYIIEWRGFP